MKNSKLLIIIVIVLIVGVGAYFLYKSNSKENFSGSFVPLAGVSIAGIGPAPSEEYLTSSNNEVKCSTCL